MARRGAILVEGHGELGAVDNLVARLWAVHGQPGRWHPARRWKNLHTREGLVRAVASCRRAEVGAVLVLRDADEGCPRTLAPAAAADLAALDLPFPAALVLFKPEFEVLFLPCLPSLAGRRLDGRAALRPGAQWDGASWEQRRGVKEWLSSQYAPGKRYKPTLDQEPLTRLLDLDVVRRAEVPCFGTLERALAFLHEAWDGAGAVYPPPSGR